MEAERILSADSHVIEPADVWTARIDKRFARSRTVSHQEFRWSRRRFLCRRRLRPFAVAGFAVAGVDPKDFAEKMAGGYPGVRPSAWDPDCGLRTRSATAFSPRCFTPALGCASSSSRMARCGRRAFAPTMIGSRTIAQGVPRRLAGVAMVALDDIDAGVEEFSARRRRASAVR